MIQISFNDKEVIRCSSAILIPVKAIDEAGYIKTLTVKNDASAKHEFHAMAQMAYYQYQDDELDITTGTGNLKIVMGDAREEVDAGMILCRQADGAFQVFAHGGLNYKKLLEAAYRFCTRWVRLDI